MHNNIAPRTGSRIGMRFLFSDVYDSFLLNQSHVIYAISTRIFIFAMVIKTITHYTSPWYQVSRANQVHWSMCRWCDIKRYDKIFHEHFLSAQLDSVYPSGCKYL